MAGSYNLEKHHCCSIRLKRYNYVQKGTYYVTICTQNRECMFGEVIDGAMQINEYDEIAVSCLRRIPKHFGHVNIDYMIVMPNHVHLILIINDEGSRGTVCRAPTVERFGAPVAGSVPSIIRSYKSAVTKQINLLRIHAGMPVWQRKCNKY